MTHCHCSKKLTGNQHVANTQRIVWVFVCLLHCGNINQVTQYVVTASILMGTLSFCLRLLEQNVKSWKINLHFVSLHKLQHISDMICIVKYAIYLRWASSEALLFGMTGMKHYCVAAIFHLGNPPPPKKPWTGPKLLMDVFVMRL